MQYQVTKDKQHEKSFAVALLEVPALPENADNIQDVVRKPLSAVVAAVDNGEGWSFTTLSKEEKRTIGDQLVEAGAGFSEWWWCLQYVDA